MLAFFLFPSLLLLVVVVVVLLPLLLLVVVVVLFAAPLTLPHAVTPICDQGLKRSTITFIVHSLDRDRDPENLLVRNLDLSIKEHLET